MNRHKVILQKRSQFSECKRCSQRIGSNSLYYYILNPSTSWEQGFHKECLEKELEGVIDNLKRRLLSKEQALKEFKEISEHELEIIAAREL